MKKVLIALCALCIASFAYATDNTWYVSWSLGTGWAISPTNPSHGVLEDFNVTWSLMNAADDTVLDGGLATMHANKGEQIWFNDSANGGGNPTFTLWLDGPSSPTTYMGSTTLTSSQSIYQLIYAENGTEAYEWKSGTIDVTPISGERQGVAQNWGNKIVLGPDGASGVTAVWTKVDNPTSVPEPATLSLLGLGALAVALRRKLRK